MKKRILIANNKKINRPIKNEIEIVSDNIQYKEGILEILELNKNINYIIFSEDLIGQIKNEKLIQEILNINKNIIIYIFVNKKIKFIKNNKNIIKNKNIKIIENENDNKLNEIFLEKENSDININKKENNKIISISGTGGVGKSITILKIAKYLEKKNKKILIIDLDYLNKSIGLILGINEIKEIIKINKKIDLIEYNNKIEIINNLKIYKEKYDYILIDTSSEILLELMSKILNISDINIFLVEPNLLGIKKANTLLKIYTENWNIEKNKIKIIFNKYNKYSIKYEIIKKIFSKFKIIGRIKINEKYDLIINKNNLNYLIKNNKHPYKRIIRKINKKIYKIKGEKILWN